MFWCVALCGAACSCGESRPVPQENRAFETHGVSFLYPDTWHVIADTSAAPLIVEIELDGPNQSFCDIAVYGDTAQANVLVEETLAQFRDLFAPGREGKVAPISRTLAEAEAEGVVWSVSSMSGQRVVSILATNVHNRAVAVYWQAFAGDLEHVRREIEPIMRTLRVDALPQR